MPNENGGNAMTIEKLQIEVAASTGKAVTGLKKLETVLQRLNKLGEQSGFTELYIKLRKIASLDFSKATSTMGAFTQGAKNMGKAAKSFDRVSKSIKMTKTQVSELTNSLMVLNKNNKVSSFGGFSYGGGKSEFERLWELYSRIQRARESIPKLDKAQEWKPDWVEYEYSYAEKVKNAYESAFQAAKREFDYRSRIKRLNEGQTYYPATQGSRGWSYGGSRNRDFGFQSKAFLGRGRGEPNWDIPFNNFDAMYRAFRGRMEFPRLESANMEAAFHETTRMEGIMFKMKHTFDSASMSAKNFFHEMKRGVRDLREFNKNSRKAYTTFSAMKTILMYSLLFTAVSTISKGITEGLQNVALYSKEVNQLVTEYKTLGLQIKNSIGAALVPILQTLLPLVRQLSNVLIDISNSINVIFAAMNGNKTFIVAKKYVDDYVKSLGKLKGMAGMDQINVIGNQYNYSDMFETIDRGSKDVGIAAFNIAELASAIGLVAALFKAPEWAKSLSIILGKTIKWQKVLKKCAGFFSAILGFAELMEGAIRAWTDGIDWGNFLQMLGGALLLTGGLWLMFGEIGAAIGLVVGGITLVVVGIKDLVNNGRNAQNTFAILVGILAVGAGLAIAGFGWIALAIAAVVAAITALAIWGDKIQESIQGFVKKANEWFDGIREKVKGFFDNLTDRVKNVSPLLGSVIDHVANGIDFIINLVQDIFVSFSTLFGDISEMLYHLFHGEWKELFGSAKKFLKDWFSSIGNIAISIFNFVIGGFEGFVNLFVYGINSIINGLNKISFQLPDWKWLGDLAGARYGIQIPLVPEASLGRIPKYAEGGFPEDGLFMANSGEMVGKFLNGRSAVANNEQIVEGISRGVYEATSEQSDLLREQNKILMALLEKESGGGISISSITRGLERQNRRNGRVIVPVGN